MNILVASDKFKGSLTATEACRAIRTGLEEGCANWDTPPQIHTLPVADGGDGIAGTLTVAQSGTWRSCSVHDALGSPVEAGYGIVDNGNTAVIEMAEASGLALLGDRKKAPWSASTFGTGELVLDAVRRGVRQIILGIGGSATNDGGAGMALALGWKFLDASGEKVSDIPDGLPRVATILPPEKPVTSEVLVACDVENPLLGPEGCTRIYGPQKGIKSDEFEIHEARLQHLVKLLGNDAARSASQPGSGAAGGLGFGAAIFLNATLRPGFDLVAGQLDLESHISRADLVITGEGRLDAQTESGKAPAGVARLSREHSKEVYAFCGSKEEGAGRGFAGVFEIRNPDKTLAENMASAAALLQASAKEFATGLVEPVL
ncbi:MAG: glycerate kinase [Verrucomicrobiales bacterium]|nr:glycerate kinase [Verrucomicrobiales bacterium]